jgi:hypothetical protein
LQLSWQVVIARQVIGNKLPLSVIKVEPLQKLKLQNFNQLVCANIHGFSKVELNFHCCVLVLGDIPIKRSVFSQGLVARYD